MLYNSYENGVIFITVELTGKGRACIPVGLKIGRRNYLTAWQTPVSVQV